MYTLKFINFFEDGSNVTDVISCVHYSVYERKNGITSVTTYQTMLDQDGVERHLMHDDALSTEDGPSYFGSCYVENNQGKTIFVIRPLAPSKEGVK